VDTRRIQKVKILINKKLPMKAHERRIKREVPLIIKLSKLTTLIYSNGEMIT
jgi:hypothetical protein